MPVRVALVDDDQSIHDMIADLLHATADAALVGRVYRGEDALALVERVRPDILLMDIRMPGISGMEATQQVHAAHPEVRIMALSSYQEYDYILAMLNNGATSYLVKDALADDLVDTILMTHQGNTVLSPTVKEILLSPPPVVSNRFNLTERELEVVALMGRGLNNLQIAAELQISSSTVSFHLNNILAKMDLQTRSEVLVVAARNNLI